MKLPTGIGNLAAALTFVARLDSDPFPSILANDLADFLQERAISGSNPYLEFDELLH